MMRGGQLIICSTDHRDSWGHFHTLGENMTETKSRRKRTIKPSSNGAVEDGTLTIDVKGGTYDGQTVIMDLMLLRLCSEEARAKHPLEERDGMVEPTAAFVSALDANLRNLGYKSTPAIAVHAWQKMCEHFATIQKKTKQSPSSRIGTE